MNALVPRVSMVCVVGTSALSEPRTPVSAATQFAGFANDATLKTYRTAGSCAEFAGLHSIQPSVAEILAPSKTAISIPRTARSAAADPTGFIEHAAIVASHDL